MYSERILKSETDIFWDTRSTIEKDPQKVNISDLVQRDLECDFILKHLDKSHCLLEVGCGNCFLTSMLRDNIIHNPDANFLSFLLELKKADFFHFHLSKLDTKNKYLACKIYCSLTTEAKPDTQTLDHNLLNSKKIIDVSFVFSDYARAYLDSHSEINVVHNTKANQELIKMLIYR